MNQVLANPWADRFLTLLDAETIRLRATVAVPPITGLTQMPIELAVKKVESALNSVFYPTSQCVTILQRLCGLAQAHCLMHYPDTLAYSNGIYAREAPLPGCSQPICLTGLAGVGKSCLLQAFLRLQPSDSEVMTDTKHSPFPLKRPWIVSVHASSRPSEVLARLAGSKETLSDLVSACRKLAYRDGIALLGVDEFQFATGSSDANTRVAQMLLSLTYIGLPFLYVANFSLLRRLQKRPEEERQRLLADPVVLLPDPPESEDWQNTLASQRDVAPEVFTFSVSHDARELHLLTFGRKRAMKHLLITAFRQSFRLNEEVNMAALRRAYASPEYASFRTEAEILTTQSIRNGPDKHRMDLWCPIPLPPDKTAQFTNTACQARAEKVADAELRSSLTKEERNAVEAMERKAKKASRSPSQVVPLKKAPPTADDLKRNAQRFRDSL